jgi:uncharacterized protein (TIGR00369 family)
MTQVGAAMEHVVAWIEKSAYARTLGVEIGAVGSDGVRLALPYTDSNSNPGQVLHGGVAASLIGMAGQAVARASLGADAAPFHTIALQVTYLAAAKASAIVATARRLRGGKELCFVDVVVVTDDGKPVAHGLVASRGRFGADPVELPPTRGDDGAADPGRMGPHVSKIPFMAKLGARVEHMVDAQSRVVLPLVESNADAAGGVHEGAALALLDTTGAMAAWAVTGPGPYKASTPSLQAQFLAPPAAEPLVGYGRSIHRDAEAHWCDVEVAGAESRRVYARGTVLNPIVTK